MPTLKSYLEAELKVKGKDVTLESELEELKECTEEFGPDDPIVALERLNISMKAAWSDKTIEDFKLEGLEGDAIKKSIEDLCRKFYTSQGYREDIEREYCALVFERPGERRNVSITLATILYSENKYLLVTVSRDFLENYSQSKEIH